MLSNLSCHQEPGDIVEIIRRYKHSLACLLLMMSLALPPGTRDHMWPLASADYQPQDQANMRDPNAKLPRREVHLVCLRDPSCPCRMSTPMMLQQSLDQLGAAWLPCRETRSMTTYGTGQP